MARDDEQQAMTAERLAWVMEHIASIHPEREHTSVPVADLRLLLAEVKRLRAREAALLAVVRLVADGKVVSVDEDMWGLLLADLRRSFVQTIHEQARALLASTVERSGGDGA